MRLFYRRFFRAFRGVLPLFCLLSCFRSKPPEPFPSYSPEIVNETTADNEKDEDFPDLAETIARLTGNIADGAGGAAGFSGQLSGVFRNAEIPEDMARSITASLSGSPAFILDLLSCLEEDPFLRMLVDKQHPLPGAYEPSDLVELRDGSYKVSRAALMLRRAAADALGEMAAAAGAEGITLVASSAYRSYNYQVEVYSRIVRELGQEAADRESARPGFSQHQTGLALDFGSIDDSFAETAAGRWIAANASRFGWSISFPRGYEEITGYRWESWHYRYVGREIAAFIDNYFGGVQQYALRFLFEWEQQRDYP